MTIVTKMNMMLSLVLRRLPPHRITTTSRSCYFSISAPKTSSEEELVASFSNWKCIGSSHGWLGYVNPRDSSFYLYKPSLLNHPSYLPYISLPPYNDNISKMIFSSSPTPIQRLARNNVSDNSSVLAVLITDWPFCHHGAAVFCRMGDPNWTKLSNFPVSQMPMKRGKWLCSDTSFQDIAYDSKHNLFYVITNFGEIYSWDLSNYRYCSMKTKQDCNFQYLIKPPSTKFPPPNLPNEKHLNQGIKYYLVMDESSGALLMIRLLIYYTHYKSKKSIFWDIPHSKSYIHDIHSLQFDNKLDLKWFPLIGLVDTALFIGRNNGIAVDVRQVPGMVTPGYIYLACNAFGFFQLSALLFSYCGQSHFEQSISIIRAEKKWSMDRAFNSFPVWNFE